MHFRYNSCFLDNKKVLKVEKEYEEILVIAFNNLGAITEWENFLKLLLCDGIEKEERKLIVSEIEFKVNV